MSEGGRCAPWSAKFCLECGQGVAVSGALTAVTASASPEAFTPRHLAERILTAKAALEGERKQVTVLFADAVHRFEGTGNQVMGDGIMALFGAPIAHEDHAVRACYAAPRMQDSERRQHERPAARGGPSMAAAP